jgi:predicted dinucleotide-binding enzyme
MSRGTAAASSNSKEKRIMTYAIIGSGAIGHALALRFARKKIPVLITNSRGPASLKDVVRELGPSVTAATIAEALRADVVIMATPFNAVSQIVQGATTWLGRVVVDATNAIEFPAFTPADLGGRLSTEVVADAVSGAGVVKAFNTLPAAVLASEPEQQGGRRVVFLSGNTPEANSAIAKLIASLGFAAIDLGRLSEGGKIQQFGGPLVGIDLIRHPSAAR